MKKNNRNGFTLIELLVVISIIALLMSILMPSLAKVKQIAKRRVCASSIKQQMLAMHAYASDHWKYPHAVQPGFWPFGGMSYVEDGKPLPPYVPPGCYDWKPAGQAALWAGNYLDTPELFYCPSARAFKIDTIFTQYQADPATNSRVANGSLYDASNINFSSLYIGYCYWVDYSFNPASEQTPQARKDTARSHTSAGHTVAITDTIFTQNIPLETPDFDDMDDFAHIWSNHIDKGQLSGGNIGYNDGAVKWADFRNLHEEYETHLRCDRWGSIYAWF